MNTILEAETADRLQLVDFCCENIFRAACRYVLDHASRQTCRSLLVAMADVLISHMQQPASAAPAVAAAAGQGVGNGYKQAQLERVLNRILETWKGVQKEEEEEQAGVPAPYEELIGKRVQQKLRCE